MNEMRTVFLEKVQRTDTVASFRFKPSQHVAFIPGQFLQVVFDEANPQNRDRNKYLSFSSSPAKDYIEVTKRLSDSAFSQQLLSLQPGDSVLLKGPMGNCVYSDAMDRIAFIIGGIGITPVISILDYIAETKQAVDVCLIYSNRTYDDIAFYAELEKLRELIPSLHITYAVDSCDDSDVPCHVGFINEELIKTSMCDLHDRLIFIYGPPVMVSAMKSLCTTLQCDAIKLKAENFVGY